MSAGKLLKEGWVAGKLLKNKCVSILIKSK